MKSEVNVYFEYEEEDVKVADNEEGESLSGSLFALLNSAKESKKTPKSKPKVSKEVDEPKATRKSISSKVSTIESDYGSYGDPTLIDEKPKKKKKGKKSKTFGDVAILDDEDEASDGYIDFNRILNGRGDSDDDDDIISEQRKSYKKNKKGSDVYKKEFAEELTLLYTHLHDNKAFGKELDKIFKEMTKRKIGSVSRNTSELANVINSSRQSQLATIKEIVNIKKIIADLNIKSTKGDKDKDTASNFQNVAAAYLNNVVKMGRKQYLENTLGNDEEYDDEFEGEYVSDDELDTLNDTLLDSIERDNKSEDEDDSVEDMRKPSGRFADYESLEPKIVVHKDIESGDWEFMAIDKYNQEIPEYPMLPDRDKVKPVKFNSEGTYCTDRFSRSYKVIESY